MKRKGKDKVINTNIITEYIFVCNDSVSRKQVTGEEIKLKPIPKKKNYFNL